MSGPRKPIGSVQNPRVRLDTRTLAARLRNATRQDGLYRAALEAAAAQARVPFLHVVYEELCARPDGFAAVFRFLGLAADEAQTRAAVAKVATRKVHTMPKAALIANYAEVRQSLAEAGLGWYLRDEDCTLAHG